MMSAAKIRKRLHDIADRIDPKFDRPDVLPTLEAATKGIDAIEKIIGYCSDKLAPTPLEDRASPERLAARAKDKTAG